MLDALESGVKGGKWFSLWDKVYSVENLSAAWTRVRTNKGSPGVDRQTIDQFQKHAEEHIKYLSEELKAGRYRPQAVRRKMIPKPGTTKMRPLGIPTIKDRIVQGAIRNVIEPIFEAQFEPTSFGFRPGRSCRGAIVRVQQLLDAGCTHVVDADIQSYFDTIPQEQLMVEVEKKLSDGKLLGLLRSYLTQPIMEDLKEWIPTKGTPQGAVISPLLANIYLHPVDQLLRKHGFEAVRYADDLVILCKSKEKADEALELLSTKMTELGLTLHPEKTKIVDATKSGGFDFLGYHFERGYRWPRDKSLQALKDRVRALTPRNFGHSTQQMVADLNRVIRGWVNYFWDGVSNVMSDLDGWVRRRMRSIFRRRSHRKGISRGRDHNRWPNAYFESLGLLSFEAAQRELIERLRPSDRRAGCGKTARPVRREGSPA